MPNRVSGIYSGNDGGFYYVRFVGDAVGGPGGPVFWFGEHPDGHFANVMAGTLNVFPDGSFNIENGRWWDVPKGAGMGASSPSRPETQLDLMVRGNTITKSLDSGGGFGGSRWTKIGSRPRRAGVNLLGSSGEGLTGVWIGDDGGIYYIRQTGSEVAWFGESCSPPETVPAFGNVFVGSLSGTHVNGSWADVPYGGTGGAGSLSFRVEGDTLVRTAVTGGFGGSSWTRSRVSSRTLISVLRVTVTTATSTPGRNPDDLRHGSVDYGVVELSGGRTLPKVSLNQGRGLPPGASATAEINLPPGTRRGDLVSLTLEHDGAPRNWPDTYDNWDVGTVEIAFRMPSTPCVGRVLTLSDTPLVRLTGERPTHRIAIPAIA